MRRSLLLLSPHSHPAVRILFFPYAGGTATHLHSWAKRFPPSVQLSGVRYTAWDDPAAQPAHRTPQSIAACLFEEVAGLADLPLILFGYSLGALIAYEVCVELSRHGIDAPADLVVAAARAPDIPRQEPPVAGLSDAQLIARLRRYGGTPESVLQDQDMIEFLLPAIRADFAVVESYGYSQSPPLRCPITAIGGSSDELAGPAAVAAWQARTSGAFAHHQLEGGHFFLHQQPHSVVAILRRLANRHVTDLCDTHESGR